MSDFRPLSALAPAECAWIAEFLGGGGILPLYFATAQESLLGGTDNGLILIGRRQRGLVLGISFAALEAFTYVGQLEDDELLLAAARPIPSELHAPTEIAARLRPLLGSRLTAEHAMRIETCAIGAQSSDPACRLMSARDADRLTAFYRAYNPRSVFSPWMLEHPFVAIEEQGEILASAGVLALSRKLGSAVIGNFLTHPDRRDLGLARRVGQTLLAALGAIGIRHAALVTTEGNQSARKVYQNLGFALDERWVQFDLH
jgi:GNAT superfamily N-acetyltransferase